MSQPASSLHQVPRGRQLPPHKLLAMSAGNIRVHLAASCLQAATIAATAAFLTLVLCAMAAMRRAQEIELPAASAGRGEMQQLGWLLAVALIVCAISNVTSMLLAVAKRFREIGTMKCLGAFDRTILRLFLVESVLISGAGALGGAAAGIVLATGIMGATYGAAVFSRGLWGAWMLSGAASLVVVVALSFAGAAYPSWQASRMLPIEAMRKV